MQFYHVVPLPHSIQWCPSLFFSELCTISLLLPHSWQMASAHIIHEKWKLSDGNFIPLPPPPTNFPRLCTSSLPFFLFHQLSVTPSIWIHFFPWYFGSDPFCTLQDLPDTSYWMMGKYFKFRISKIDVMILLHPKSKSLFSFFYFSDSTIHPSKNQKSGGCFYYCSLPH